MGDYGKCAQCKLSDRICRGPGGHYPTFCSTILYSDALKKAAEEYKIDDIGEIARQASVQEAECYIDRGSEPNKRSNCEIVGEER
ncbi:hypothetical protein AXX12_17375 [Anaerosporomusa subterranea]|uniref:Uncharacterized protein n=1 Tax=Anaerosporomusa subterranea TaxID=1794912 RepID=A0A154BUY3_ANASB|nr:hypothetical protein AXX12_17375 [Anaerosporomusa subterranea]